MLVLLLIKNHISFVCPTEPVRGHTKVVIWVKGPVDIYAVFNEVPKFKK